MKRSLLRGLTLIPATALIVTTVIGTGVFVKARVMVCNVGTPWMVLLAYLVAGILTLGGALTFAELGAMMPPLGWAVQFHRRGVWPSLGISLRVDGNTGGRSGEHCSHRYRIRYFPE